jgi:hypothetical protein
MDIDILKKEKEELLRKRTERQDFYKAKQSEFAGVEELKSIDDEIKKKDSEIEQTSIEISKMECARIVAQATALLEEKNRHLQAIEEIGKKAEVLKQDFVKKIPRKRIQTQTTQRVKMERTTSRKTLIGFDKFGEKPFHETESKTEYQEIRALKSYIEKAESHGWRLLSGQTIKPEPLNSQNSQEIELIHLDPIFDQFHEKVRTVPFPLYIPLSA